MGIERNKFGHKLIMVMMNIDGCPIYYSDHFYVFGSLHKNFKIALTRKYLNKFLYF